MSVFYGALSENVAVAEMRPSIGGLVIVGSFTIARELRLLDLTKAGDAVEGSIFAPNYHERAARLRFLRSFHYLITRPVQEAEEALEYLPTQAVAEYVTGILRFDGILYGSAQTGTLDELFDPEESSVPADATKCNVVIWGDPSPRTGWDPSATHPVTYDEGSAHGVWITQVKIRYSTVNLDDERGDPPDADF